MTRKDAQQRVTHSAKMGHFTAVLFPARVRAHVEIVRAAPGNGATDGRRNEICGVAANRPRKQNLHFNDDARDTEKRRDAGSTRLRTGVCGGISPANSQ